MPVFGCKFKNKTFSLAYVFQKQSFVFAIEKGRLNRPKKYHENKKNQNSVNPS